MSTQTLACDLIRSQPKRFKSCCRSLPRHADRVPRLFDYSIMTPTSLALTPHPHPQPRPQGAVAATNAAAPAPPPPPHGGKYSFDEVAKLFYLPIAEAAVILGVCTSVLKRICRKNGIGRWPYRKFLAGKTVEEIKKDAAREKELSDASKAAKQRFDLPNVTSSSLAGLPSNFGNQVLNRPPGLLHETSLMQRGVSVPGHVMHLQNNNYLHFKLPNMSQFNPVKNVPTYMDEFKYGFPAKGLSSASSKWWGSGSNDGTERTEKEVIKGSCVSSTETVSDQTESSLDESGDKAEPIMTLCSLRRKAVQGGHDSFKLGISKGRVGHKLSKRQRLLLLRLFGSSTPDQWKNMCC